MIAKWLPEDFLKTIVLFEVPNKEGVFIPHGTGVLLNYENVLFVATCKHIIMKPDGNRYEKLQATINKTDGTVSRKDIETIQKALNLQWFFNKDQNVDLALSPIAILKGVEDTKFIGKDLFENFTDMPLGDDIFFLGYPLGLGVKNVPKLSPLIRTGIVALKNSDSTFLVDANIYPGSSGSPVFYKPVIAQNEEKVTNIGSTRPIKFLGIINSNISSIEEAISKKTGRTRAIFEENAGLGTVQSASLLNEIFEYPEVQALILKAKKALPQTEETPAQEIPKKIHPQPQENPDVASENL